MRNEDHADELIVKQKLERIQELLNEVSSSFDFQYMLHFSLSNTDTKKVVTAGCLIPDNLRNSALNIFWNQVLALKQGQDILLGSIAMGKLIVLCVDASCPPTGIKDWVQENKWYVVQQMIVSTDTDDKKIILRLEGMNPGQHLSGYRADRFIPLFANTNVN